MNILHKLMMIDCNKMVYFIKLRFMAKKVFGLRLNFVSGCLKKQNKNAWAINCPRYTCCLK
ncbi:MAG: hypothetical protein IIU35_00530 [Neisseriaceae bacterium]|nr:hypothetical protein [Neisseriaceae bacterium]